MSANAVEMTVTQPLLLSLSPPLGKCAVNQRLLEISVVWCHRGRGNVPHAAFRVLYEGVSSGFPAEDENLKIFFDRMANRIVASMFPQCFVSRETFALARLFILKHNLSPFINLMT